LRKKDENYGGMIEGRRRKGKKGKRIESGGKGGGG